MVVPFLSLYLTKDLGFSLGEVGWIMSAFGAGSLVGSWLGGKLTDKVGYYKTMVVSLIASGCLFIGLQFLTSFLYFCLGIFTLMIVADMFRPAMYVSLNAYSKEENKTRSITLVRLAINLGFSAGPAIGGFIITTLSYSGLFWVDGISCMVAGLLLLKLLNPGKTKVLDVPNLTFAPSVYKDTFYLLFLGTLVLAFTAFLQYFSTVPLYYKNAHYLSEFEIGLLLGMNGLLIFIFEMPIIQLLDRGRPGSILKLIIVGITFITISYALFLTSSWSGILIIGMLVMTVGEMIAFPFANTFALKRSKGKNQGEYMALYSIAFSIAHIVGHNSGMQLVKNFGYPTTWFTIIVLLLLSMLLLGYLVKNLKQNGE